MNQKGKPETAEAVPKQTTLEHRKIENFDRRYANNVYLEGNQWDLKITFGEVDLSLGENVILQHTAVNIPWALAKTLAYLIHFQVIGHEATMGRVKIPGGVIAPLPAEMPDSLKKANVSEETYAKGRALFEQFIKENPEAGPPGRKQ